MHKKWDLGKGYEKSKKGSIIYVAQEVNDLTLGLACLSLAKVERT